MHILIIDDMQADHDIAEEYLKETGGDYHFHHAYNADAGLELYRRRPISCVLLDYHMPGKDGLELLRRLAQSEPSAPVIMMTGEGDETVAVAAMKLGAQDYISKSALSPGALKRAVERAIERSFMVRSVGRYRAELERSNHDLEQFAHIVAHDLKSPLRAITQHLTLIGNRCTPPLDEKSMRSLGFAVEGASRMRMLIDALFEYARLGFSEPQFAAVSLETLLAQTLDDLCAVIGESKAHITHDPMPDVKGDAILLAQLFQNLIANAIKYSEETPRIHISATQQSGSWRIGVSDNGIGIPPARRQDIFAIFRRLHAEEDYPGIGLGLAICERIVKQHGGMIEVESNTPKGSRFTFTLPVCESFATPQQRIAHA